MRTANRVKPKTDFGIEVRLFTAQTGMKPLKTAHDMFYFVEDVMQILGYSKSKSYKVIKSLNRELENQGKCTCDGRVIKRYFHERYGLDELNASARRGA